MKDVEKIFRNADFEKGSGHRARLRDSLFGTEEQGSGFSGMILDDVELDQAAGGADLRNALKTNRTNRKKRRK